MAESVDRLLRVQIEYFDAIDPATPWAGAHSLIATRIVDDLRASAGLVLRGYFLQAMTLGATIYELSYTAGFIGMDEARANVWLEWTDFDATPWKRRVMVAEVRAQAYESDTPGDGPGLDARYMALCWGKHGNPYLQRSAGVAATPEAHVLNLDPGLGGKAHRLGELALWLIIEPILTYVALLFRLDTLSPRALDLTSAAWDLWRPFNGRLQPHGRDSA